MTANKQIRRNSSVGKCTWKQPLTAKLTVRLNWQEISNVTCLYWNFSHHINWHTNVLQNVFARPLFCAEDTDFECYHHAQCSYEICITTQGDSGTLSIAPKAQLQITEYVPANYSFKIQIAVQPEHCEEYSIRLLASVIFFDCGRDCFWNCILILKSAHSTVVRNMKGVWMLHMKIF